MIQNRSNRKLTGRKIGISQWGHEGYYQAIERAGGDVYIINNETRLDRFDELAGVVIPGGRDVDTKWYTKDRDPRSQSPDRYRDTLEMAFVDRAIKKGIPLFGVCRGIQVMNVQLGGSLIQHIKGHTGHSHPVHIENGTRHFGHIKNHDIYVNSLHHQAIERLGKGLSVAAISNDGLIEAVELRDHVFAVGVQWHPEMSHTPRFDREMFALWKKFINARK